MAATIPMDPSQMWAALNEQFMSQVQTVIQLYDEFDRHKLSLLSDADFRVRAEQIGILVGVGINCVKRRIQFEWAINEAEKYLDACYDKVKAGKKVVKDEETGEEKEVQQYKKILKEGMGKKAEKWRLRILQAQPTIRRNDTIYKECLGEFDLFRPMGLVEVFKAYEKKANSIFGVPQAGMDKVKEFIEKKVKRKQDDAKADGLPADLPEAA